MRKIDLEIIKYLCDVHTRQIAYMEATKLQAAKEKGNAKAIYKRFMDFVDGEIESKDSIRQALQEIRDANGGKT